MARVTNCPNSPDAAYVVPNFAQRQVDAIPALRKFPAIDLQLYLQPFKPEHCDSARQKTYGSFRFREAAALVVSTKKNEVTSGLEGTY
jgi:hypothetical protein